MYQHVQGFVLRPLTGLTKLEVSKNKLNDSQVYSVSQIVANRYTCFVLLVKKKVHALSELDETDQLETMPSTDIFRRQAHHESDKKSTGTDMTILDPLCFVSRSLHCKACHHCHASPR